jgi:predicted transcriptional regulator
LVRVAGPLKERMLASLADPESQRILITVVAKPKTTAEIEKVVGLPQSTVYRKISELKGSGLLMIERYAIRPDGRREAVYACPFAELRFKAVDGETELEVIQTEESLERRWFELFFSKQHVS